MVDPIDAADTVDHTVPLWFLEGNEDLIARCRFYKVQACHDCNHRAGHVVDRTFYARKSRIAKSLRAAKRRFLITADWDDEELAELGYSLRHAIIVARDVQQHILWRLRVLADRKLPQGMPWAFFSGVNGKGVFEGRMSRLVDGEEAA